MNRRNESEEYDDRYGPPDCKECDDRRYIDFFICKLINNPAHVYVIASYRDLCPRCGPL